MTKKINNQKNIAKTILGCFMLVITISIITFSLASSLTELKEHTDNYGNLIPENCKVWFDGCNTCTVSEDGMIGCTKKYCQELEEPKCVEYNENDRVQNDCFCTMEYNPVCGIDGNTYGNPCVAECENVEIDYFGECENYLDTNKPTIKGEIISISDNSVLIAEGIEGEYNGSFENLIGNAIWFSINRETIFLNYESREEIAFKEFNVGDKVYVWNTGLILETYPAQTTAYAIALVESNYVKDCFCTLEYNPVCGIDGNTYGNPCVAECENVEIDYFGECENNDAIACAMDMEKCPDGTWVGRTGPDCEFICPTQKNLFERIWTRITSLFKR